jgi:hypothetical protein
MGRKRRSGTHNQKKKSGGLLMGMRGGIKSAAGTVSGSKKPTRIGNVITVALLILALVLVARRFGAF